jgi:hypothetical protein
MRCAVLVGLLAVAVALPHPALAAELDSANVSSAGRERASGSLDQARDRLRAAEAEIARIDAVLPALRARASPLDKVADQRARPAAATRSRHQLRAALLSAAAPAPADLRTGSHANRYPDPDKSSPTRPELDRAQIRYDADAGQLDATVFLYDGLADPARTSALRPWAVKVTVGDFMSNGTCVGDLATWLRIDAGLGDADRGALTHWVDFDDKLPALAVTKTFNEDRSVVSLSIAHESLRGLNLICADVEVLDVRPDHDDFSETFGFMLDGLSPLDGAVQREGTDELASQILWVNNNWGKGKGDASYIPGARCRQLYIGELSCRASARLPEVPGRPRLTLRGRMTLDGKRARRLSGDSHAWSYRMRATVRWRHCPRTRDVPRRLRGKRCHLTVRWNGRRPLYFMLG